MFRPEKCELGLWKLQILFALLSLAAAHPQNSDDAGRVVALETSWNQAEQQRDIKALENLLGGNFINIDVDGSFKNRSEFLDGITNRAEHIDAIGVEPGSEKVYVYGNSAIATGIYTEKGTLRGKAYFNRGRFTDTWIKQGSAWVCVASQSTLIQK